MPPDPECLFCFMYKKVLTKWHWVDDLVIVCDCLTCTENGIEDHIMVVLRRHSAQPTEQEAQHMQEIAHACGLEVTRKTARVCPEHTHWHARRRHQKKD